MQISTIANQNTRDPEGQSIGSLQLNKTVTISEGNKTLNLQTTIFQKKPVYTAFKGFEPRTRNCINNTVWETVPDPRSCVDKASIHLMSFCSRNRDSVIRSRSTGPGHTPPF